MKKILIITTVFFLSALTIIQAQTSVRKLNDGSIVAQEKRQVFEKWGDWRPKAKYVLGIQVNLAYATVWGNWAPSRNRQYKRGKDIRPLGPAGLQNQRYASTLLEEQASEQTIQQIDSTYKQATDELLHYTGLTAPADPLYLLYYKKMLTPLDNFDANSQYYKDWGLASEEIYQDCIKYGLLEQTKRTIETLQEKYDMARSIDIARGKRILMYHECLIEWRKCISYLSYLNNTQRIKFEVMDKLKKAKNEKPKSRARTDAEIYTDVLMRIGI